MVYITFATISARKSYKEVRRWWIIHAWKSNNETMLFSYFSFRYFSIFLESLYVEIPMITDRVKT